MYARQEKCFIHIDKCVSTLYGFMKWVHGICTLLNDFKVIEKCTKFYFGTEKLPPKF